MGNLTGSLLVRAMANLTQITGGFTPSVHVHTKKAYGLNIYQILIIFPFIYIYLFIYMIYIFIYVTYTVTSTCRYSGR